MKYSKSFTIHIAIQYLRLKLQKRLEDEYQLEEDENKGILLSQHLDMITFFKMTSILKQLRIIIQPQIEHQINYWKVVMSEKPELDQILKICKLRHKIKVKVLKYWSQINSTLTDRYKTPFLLYGTYLTLANNQLAQGQELLNKCFKSVRDRKQDSYIEELNNETLFSSHNLQIGISGQKSSLGRIVDCSSNIESYFRVSKDKAIGRSIDCLMSNFFRERHHQFLIDYSLSGKGSLLNTTRMVYGQDLDGFLVPLWIHVKINPDMKQGLQFLGLLRPSILEQRVITVKEDGKIESLTTKIASELGLLNEQNQFGFKLQQICPEFREVNKAINMITRKKTAISSKENNLTKNLATKTGFAKDPRLQINFHTRNTIMSEQSLFSDDSFSRLGISREDLYDTNKSDKYQSLYEQFTSIGGKLSFIALNKYMNSNLNSRTKISPSQTNIDMIKYQAMIQVVQYGKNFLKIVTLNKVQAEMNFTKQNISDKQFPQSKLFSEKYSHHRRMPLSASSLQSSIRKQFSFSQKQEPIRPNPNAKQNQRRSSVDMKAINDALAQIEQNGVNGQDQINFEQTNKQQDNQLDQQPQQLLQQDPQGMQQFYQILQDYDAKLKKKRSESPKQKTKKKKSHSPINQFNPKVGKPVGVQRSLFYRSMTLETSKKEDCPNPQNVVRKRRQSKTVEFVAGDKKLENFAKQQKSLSKFFSINGKNTSANNQSISNSFSSNDMSSSSGSSSDNSSSGSSSSKKSHESKNSNESNSSNIRASDSNTQSNQSKESNKTNTSLSQGKINNQNKIYIPESNKNPSNDSSLEDNSSQGEFITERLNEKKSKNSLRKQLSYSPQNQNKQNLKNFSNAYSLSEQQNEQKKSIFHKQSTLKALNSEESINSIVESPKLPHSLTSPKTPLTPQSPYSPECSEVSNTSSDNIHISNKKNLTNQNERPNFFKKVNQNNSKPNIQQKKSLTRLFSSQNFKRNVSQQNSDEENNALIPTPKGGNQKQNNRDSIQQLLYQTQNPLLLQKNSLQDNLQTDQIQSHQNQKDKSKPKKVQLKKENEGDSQSEILLQHKMLKLQKYLDIFLKSKKLSFKNLYTGLLFILMLLCVLGFWAWSGVSVVIFTNQIKIIRNINYQYNMRQFWLNYCTINVYEEILLRQGYLNIPISKLESRRYFIRQQLKDANLKLLDSIQHTTQDLRSEFYQRNIRNYQVKQGQKIFFIGKEDSFRSFNRLYSYYHDISERPFPNTPYVYDQKMEYLLTNTLNDMQIEFERIVELMKKAEKNFTEGLDSFLFLALFIVLGFTVAYVLLGLYMLYKLYQEANLFGNIILKMSLEDAISAKVGLETFKQVLLKSLEDMDIPKYMSKSELRSKELIKHHKKLQKRNGANSYLNFTGCKTSQYNGRVTLIYARIVPIAALIVGSILFYYLRTVDMFRILKIDQTETIWTLDLFQEISLASTLLLSHGFTNNSATFENKNIGSEILAKATSWSQMKNFLTVFPDAKGYYDPLEEEFFFNATCEGGYPKGLDGLTSDQDLTKSCQSVQVNGRFGLLGVIGSNFNLQLKYLKEYEIAKVDRNQLLRLLLETYKAEFGVEIVVLSVLWRFYDTVLEDFDDFKNSFRTQGIAFSLTTTVMGVFIAFLILFYFLRPFVKEEMKRKKVLAVIPIKILISSKHLKKYLLDHSNGILDKVQSLLKN